MIDQYTLDKKEAPQALEDLVAEGYLRSLPKDPITSSWGGDNVFDVYSLSHEKALDGTRYSDW